MPGKIKILHLEDVPSDVKLIWRVLKKTNPDYEKLVIETKEQFTAALTAYSPDIILSDHTLPSFNSHEALDILHATGLKIPFILITSTMSEDFAVDVIKRGADDYILKDRLERLPTAINNILERFRLEKERRFYLDEVINNEKRYRSLIENISDAIILIDQHSAILYQSPSVQRLTGFTDSDLKDKMMEEFIHPDDRQDYSVMIKWAAAHPGVSLPAQYRVMHKKGHYIWTEGTITNLLHDQSVKAFILIYRDVTKARQSEVNITRAIIKTQEDERYEIGTELHDNIGQILATSLLMLGLAGESVKAPEKDSFDQCREHLLHACVEIRNLSHRLAPAFFENMTLNETFKSLLRTFNIEDKYVIDLYFDADVKKYLVDRDMQLNFYRILQEQLSNIRKYANATRVGVDVVVHDHCLKMKISDNGVGFNVSAVKSGIGLANIRRRAELFFGKLEIDSVPGNGCELIVEIPLRNIVLTAY